MSPAGMAGLKAAYSPEKELSGQFDCLYAETLSTSAQTGKIKVVRKIILRMISAFQFTRKFAPFHFISVYKDVIFEQVDG